MINIRCIVRATDVVDLNTEINTDVKLLFYSDQFLESICSDAPVALHVAHHYL